ncbi:hypothetical protein CAAN1_01S01244 [[Candida] anglica]|uniref:tRNA-binding domain-containing protein n=1 Tax=[Candida] anglica TaxID=148631 RepID=A0ABP0EN99_9ASCO
MLRIFRSRIRSYSTTTPIYPPSLLKLQVGKILQCEKHENADSLYVSQVQVGIEEKVQICSGLVKFYRQEEMKDLDVVLLTNLKPSKMRGVKSEAMVLASETGAEENIEVCVVSPPKGAEIGDRLYFEGFSDTTQNTPTKLSSKAWKDIQTHLRTNSKGEVVYVTDDGEERKLGINDSSATSKIVNAAVR